MILNAQLGQTTRWVLIAFLVLILFVAVWLVRDIMMLTLSAVIFALLITAPVRIFVQYGMRRSIAVLLTIILALLLVVLLVVLILPSLLDQFQQLVGLLQNALNPGTYSIGTPTLDAEHLSVLLRRALQPGNLAANFDFLRGVDISGVTKQISQQLINSVTNLPSQVFPFVGSLASVLLSILVVVFMGLYFVADPGVYQRGIVSMFPLSYRPRVEQILNKIEIALRNFLQAQVLLMLLTGGSTGISLALLGVPLAGALGTLGRWSP